MNVHCIYVTAENAVLKEMDAAESVGPDWIVTSMSDEVLKHAAKFPEDLKTVMEEDVRRLVTDSCLIAT